ncbi:hypothetical protein BDW74DRAFT_188709 [Aspergillus multicolor]|uniref:uncharacterized protein n=1 Tax=Aspergillus multicolor TaxID=41759 RepID=UPI003CCDDBD8
MATCSLQLRPFVRDYLPIERACTARFSPWAPMIEAVSYEWTQYDSVNLDPDYAGPPTWERESRWPEQYDHGFVTYPYNKISLLNKSTNDDWWVHDGDLIALPEWAHQVHCIWLIRQWLYRDAFDYSPFTNISAARFHMHKDHCFLVLKTMVECKADATPILFAKDDSNLGAWRTVDPPKLCRRNERLVHLTLVATQTTAYESLNINDDDDETKDTVADATRGLRQPPSRSRQNMIRIYQQFAEIGDRPMRLLGLNIVLLCISGVLFWSSLNNPNLTTAPVLPNHPTEYSTKRVDGTLFPGPNPSIFRQPPSPEVDLAWDAITDTRPIPLTRADVLALGKDPSSSVKLPDAIFGLGDEIYAGRLDVLHQLHCLNALRRESYFEYYYSAQYASPAEAHNDTLHAFHLNHCVYMLLQNIVCRASTDVYTHVWTDAVGHPWPDFGIEHRCVDFQAILEFQRDGGVDERAFVGLRAGVGDRVHRMSSFFKKVVDPDRFGGLAGEMGEGEIA